MLLPIAVVGKLIVSIIVFFVLLGVLIGVAASKKKG